MQDARKSFSKLVKLPVSFHKFFKHPGILFIFRHGEANRSGENCHWKVVWYSSREEGAQHTMQGNTSVGQEAEWGETGGQSLDCGVFSREGMGKSG